MEHKNYGLIVDPVLPEDFVLGSSQSLEAKYGTDQINPSGDWSPFTPSTEDQSTNTGDTWACVSYGTTNAVEILARARAFNKGLNLSDRFLAKTSGTTLRQGNSPKTVADQLRHGWSVNESEWPDTETTEEYYAEIPANLKTVAIARGAEFEFGYQYITNTPAGIKTALKSSPVCIAATAWVEKGGVYVRGSFPENHWTTIITVLDNGNYLCFDSFYPFIKEVSPEACKSVAMSYYLNHQVVEESWFKKFIKQVLALFTEAPEEAPAPSTSPVEAPVVPPASPTPTPATNSRLEAFCLAIRTHEGWFPGSRSQKNNNPGNVRYSSVGYLDIYKPVLRDPQNFAVFKDYATGWLYLKNMVKAKISAQPNQTIQQFFEVYAPASDNNDPKRYAQVVASACGLKITDPISRIISAA